MIELNSLVNENIIHNTSNDCTHKSPTPPSLSTTSTSGCVKGRDNNDDQNDNQTETNHSSSLWLRLVQNLKSIM